MNKTWPAKRHKDPQPRAPMDACYFRWLWGDEGLCRRVQEIAAYEVRDERLRADCVQEAAIAVFQQPPDYSVEFYAESVARPTILATLGKERRFYRRRRTSSRPDCVDLHVWVSLEDLPVVDEICSDKELSRSAVIRAMVHWMCKEYQDGDLG